MESTYELTGLEKASVLLATLGAAKSAEVMSCLSADERELLGGQIVRMRHVKSVTRQRVLEEVNERLGRQRETAVSAEPAPLAWMERLDPADVADLVVRERPRNIALILSRFSPAGAADVLSHLPEQIRGQAVHMLAAMGPVSEAVVTAVDELMREKVAERNQHPLPGVLSGFDGRGVRNSVLSAITGKRPQTVDEPVKVETMEDIAALSDVEIESLLQRVDPNDLRLAMAVASDELKSAVMRNASRSTLDVMRDDAHSPLQAKVAEIEAAQERVMEVVRRAGGGS